MMGVYQIKNAKNNKIYIGSSSNIISRWKKHISDLHYDTHGNYKLQKDYNKFGLNIFIFSVLEVLENKKDLFKVEQQYLDKIDTKIDYNILNYSSIEFNNGIAEDYEIINFNLSEQETDFLKTNLNIIKNEKLNLIGNNKTSLSKAWYSKSNKQSLIHLKNNLFNFYQTVVKHEKIYWTSFTSYKKHLNAKGIIKRFVSLTDISKEKCNNLAYMANNFTNPDIKRKTQLSDDEFAIRVLLRWIISVSDITEPINCYIPSSRMRVLLIDWLNKLSKDGD